MTARMDKQQLLRISFAVVIFLTPISILFFLLEVGVLGRISSWAFVLGMFQYVGILVLAEPIGEIIHD